MQFKLSLPCALLLSLCACGGGNDPTPAPEDAAAGPVVNATVARAENEMEAAQDKVEARQEAEAKGEAAAEATLRDYEATSREAGEGAVAPTAQRPTTVDPAAGERLQTAPPR